jgi:hypothetical protein
VLDLNSIRREFAAVLGKDPLRHSMDKALAHCIERAYQAGMRDGGASIEAVWMPPELVPEPNTTALIAVLTDDDADFWVIKEGIHMHTGSQWVSERDGRPVTEANYRWLPELALTRSLEVTA